MIRITAIALLSTVVLTGCGKQGPAEASAQTSQKQAQPAPAKQTTDAQAAQPMANAETQAAQPTLAKSTPPVVPTKLGDPAYPLTGLTWVKGQPAQITPGKVYVVEFWATWCPPCRESIPHLTALRKKYEGKGVVFIGVSNEAVPTVKPFVANMGDKMDYNVAVDTTGAVVNGYMEAFHQGGIPPAFVVNAKGDVVWYGHPMGDLDQVIGQVLAGTYKIPS
jgi:thiol-disulfide isomerase/thioredoxin